jgi:hypothetical protein
MRRATVTLCAAEYSLGHCSLPHAVYETTILGLEVIGPSTASMRSIVRKDCKNRDRVNL